MTETVTEPGATLLAGVAFNQLVFELTETFVALELLMRRVCASAVGAPITCENDKAVGVAEIVAPAMVKVTGTVMGEVPPVTVMAA